MDRQSKSCVYLRSLVTEKRWQLLRTMGGIVILTVLYVFVYISLQMNLTGIVPSPISTTFEMIKSGSKESANVTKKRRTLIDIFHEFKMSTVSKPSNVEKRTNSQNSKLDIVWYTKPSYVNLRHCNEYIKSQCLFNNCKMSTNRSDIKHVAALVFCLTEDLGYTPPIKRQDRNPDQPWIFFYSESPTHHFQKKYRHWNWRNTMNWSMTYELDADIFRPYGFLETKKEIAERDYGAIFRRKRKFAAWAVSHCGARSKRDEFVEELILHGVQVDIFGECLDNKRVDGTELKALISREYKFYLSFENSLCKDYVTEKFFLYYSLDVVLVARGGLDYDKALPNETFINSAHYPSAKELASFLLTVGSSEEAYTRYLRNKDRYTSYTTPMFFLCSLCEKVNTFNESRRIYNDHVTHIHKQTCWKPTDLTQNGISWLMLGLTVSLIVCVCFCVICLKLNKRQISQNRLGS